MSTYIYAITAADHPQNLEGLNGVGEPAGTLRTVKSGSLGAVVSDAPGDLRAKRRDLAAHQAVLERLMADGATLPMRFGLVGPDDGAVETVLEENQDVYAERLSELDGCVEYNLKAGREEDDLLREIVAGSEEIQRLREVTRDRPEAQDEKIRLGELVSNEVQARHEAEGGELLQRLSGGAQRHTVAEPTQSHFLNASFLVRREDAADFAQAVHEEAERKGDAYSLNLHGPLPPYSFV
ncbi:GvpL/GvpF family gas vesicle protein [Streptomyces sp. WMMB 322]|uniref:GvpL/GvpF family gas vesicle protein n=1 Tax=Streptomyces sp. WMMB 322 TaxID=1286821 RepID=UPI0006E2FFB5|nr:GvpL/GvpF family gas vesicle protein [Streptomyces sp. WMMB 322]SCK52247.1 Gas vesicle synthesis protein GvpL/GvpF [Streptomyces sp. WMMB 322]